MPAKAVGTAFRAAENECLIAALLQQMDEKGALPVVLHSMNAMRHCYSRAVWRRYLHLRWIDHEFDRERPDRFWKCCREEKRLSLFRQCAEDSLQRRQKTHIHHAIGFVYCQDFNCR